jgi:hypothetical protein
MKDPKRRNFLRKIVTLTASAGVAGLLLDRLPAKSVLPRVQAADNGNLIIGQANTGSTSSSTPDLTSLSSYGNPVVFQTTNMGSGGGLQGIATAGTGVLGNTSTGTGVQGVASASGGTALNGFASVAGAMPLVAQGPGGQMQVNANGAVLAPQVGQSSPNYYYAAPNNPSNFSNSVGAGYLADGLAIPFTPHLSGNALVFAAVDLTNSNPPNSGIATFGQIWYGTGAAPSFGATLPGSGVAISPGRGNPHGSGSLFALLTGLTVGTPYWFDLGHGVEAGTGSHNNIAYVIVEI